MKWSNYNLTHPWDDTKSVIYNYAWEKLIILYNELLGIIEQNIDNLENLQNIHPDLYKELIANRMIIEDTVIESNVIIKEISNKLSSTPRLRLTINPTLDCNLRCWYCYESHIKDSYITDSIYLSILRFVEKQLTNPAIQYVDLSFFGGEPLIKAATIALPLAKEIKHLCELYEKNFKLHFTTNGVLLTKKLVDTIASIYPNTSLQIPFDGNRELHDRIKKLPNSKGTYDIILSNINYALSLGLTINIRCNFTEDNIDSFRFLIDDLCSLPNFSSSNIALSLQQVWQANITSEIFNRANKIHNYAKDKGLTSDLAGKVCVSSYCYADYINSYVINYNGDIFRCTAREFDSHNKMGKLDEQGEILIEDDEPNRIERRFKKACINCRLLPICTICSQSHKENKSEECPRNISDSDKERQLINRLKDLYLNKYIR